MIQKLQYFIGSCTDPHRNLALEEYLTDTVGEDTCILYLWQNKHTVVIGRNQNAWQECRTTELERDGGTLARRLSGGGAVYHDLGNMNYSFITDAGDRAALSMARFTQPVVEALQGLGLQAEASGRNDILVEGRKVSGTAQRLWGDRILHHGTLLFDANADMVAGALQVDPEKFRSKSTKSVRSRIGNIRSFLKQDMDMPAFWAYLKETLAGSGMVFDALTAQELAQVDALKAEKYDTWEWNYGRSPRFDMTAKRYWDGGCLEVGVSVSRGLITDVIFHGDFLSVSSLEPLTKALLGTPFRREEICRVLERYPVADLFGGITREQVLDTLFSD